jgi:hypothetical protein
LGIDEKYAVVPWDDFKVSPNASLLVLDTTRNVMAAGPPVSHDQFAIPGRFDRESQKVDAYWKTHLSNNGTLKGEIAEALHGLGYETVDFGAHQLNPEDDYPTSSSP